MAIRKCGSARGGAPNDTIFQTFTSVPGTVPVPASTLSRVTVFPPKRELAWLPVVLAALLVIYLPGLDNALVFDDESLASGQLLANYAALLELRARMFSYGSFVWVREVFGDGWWKQRLLNLAIHMGTVVVLWGLWREILKHV